MKFIKKNKKWILAIIGIILFLVLVFFFIKALLPTGTSVYGNRLDGIEEHIVADDDINKIKESLKATGHVSEVSYNNTGRILNFIIYVNDNVERKTASTLTNNIISVISADNQSYYDIQVYFDKKIEDENFPFMAYKHKTSSSFSFSK